MTDNTHAGHLPWRAPMRPVRPTTAALVPTAVLATADRHGRLPGLLLEWRRVAAGFQGRVVRPVVEANGEVLVV